jgi:RNA polymerase sigma-70 factor, ECF subfamily
MTEFSPVANGTNLQLRSDIILRFTPMTDPSAESSVDLIVKAKSGDDEALERLLGRYLPRLQRWARGRLPANARTMLETGDLVQDAIIRALPHLNAFDVRHEGALYAYLRQAVNNRIIDLYRRRARRPDREEMPEHLVANNTSPLEAALGAEAVERYEQALALLSEDDRQAIVMRVELGHDYKAIAEAMHKPSVTAARMACTRAVARLAQAMRRGG